MIDIYNSSCKVFQVDSSIVKKGYAELKNYLIEYSDANNKENNICAIYFSGHSIYYPNTENVFKKKILDQNRFEWYGLRVPQASKHIFVRDIHKQWYLSGINSDINSPELFLEFLRHETIGYKIVCIGSSAGGYAAILYGAQLNAEITYAFSPRIYMAPLDDTSNESVNPLYFRLKHTNREKYFDISNFIRNCKKPIFSYYPIHSALDKLQLNHIKRECLEDYNFHVIRFNTKKHGIPFPKEALKNVISLIPPHNIPKKIQSPIIFCINQVGIKRTLIGSILQLKKYILKKIM